MLTDVVRAGLREAGVDKESVKRGVSLAEQMQPFQDDLETVAANSIIMSVALDARIGKLEGFLHDLASRIDPED